MEFPEVHSLNTVHRGQY